MKTKEQIEDKLNELQEKLDSDFTLYFDLIRTITILKWVLNK